MDQPTQDPTEEPTDETPRRKSTRYRVQLTLEGDPTRNLVVYADSEGTARLRIDEFAQALKKPISFLLLEEAGYCTESGHLVLPTDEHHEPIVERWFEAADAKKRAAKKAQDAR